MLVIFFGAMNLSAQVNASWFADNDQGNRFEGTYKDQGIAKLSVDLLSFVAHKEAYTFGENQELSVSFYNPDKEAYLLRARELMTREFYWMQDKNTIPEPGWNHFRDWPVDHSLRKLDIGYRNLALLVKFKGNPGENLVSPVYLNLARTNQKGRNSSHYIAHFILGSSTAKGIYRLYKGKKPLDEDLLVEKNLSAKLGGKPFPLLIRHSLLLEESWYSLELMMEIEKREEEGEADYLHYVFSFYHKK